VVLSGFAGFIAIETGWMVTELGRQPWIIYGIVRTADSITPAPGLVLSFVVSTLVYVALAVTTVLLLLRLGMSSRAAENEADI
jgi:cytochrome d ubiquinol oxidase subunit I